MDTSLFRKCLVLVMCCLFVGASVVPSLSPDVLTRVVKADDGEESGSVSVVATGVELPKGWGAYQRKLVRTSNGDLHCVYRRSDGSYFQIWYACSSDGGETWTEQQITTANHNHYEPAIAVDSNDYIHVVWSWHEEPHGFGKKCTVQYRVKTEEGWQPIEDVITGYGHNPSIAVDSQDNIHLVVGGMNPGGYNTDYVKYLKRTSSGWSSPEMASPQVWADQPAIAVDQEDNVHVVFYYAPYYEPWRGLKYCKRTADGWQEEETIKPADEERSAPSMALDRYGNVYVVWGNWDTHCISIAKRTSDGWQIDDVWQENGYDQLYPSIAVDSNDYIHVVWQGKHPDSPDYWQIRYREYTSSWQSVENLTSASVNQSHPYLIWSYYPVVNGVHTNIPRNGFAFVWNDGSTIKFYKSDDLEWEIPSNQPLWQSGDIGEIRWIEVEDADGDGIDDIVVGTYTGFASNVHHGYIYVFNAVTHELEWQSDDIGCVNKVVVTDLDGDGKKEIIASVLYSRSGVIGNRYGYIYVFDGVTHNQMWQSGNIGTPRDLVVDDVDGDGVKEIITSGMDYYSCTRHGHVYVFNGTDFTREWKSGDVNSPYTIVVADVDGDGVKEIVFGNCVTDCASSSSEGGFYYPGYIYVYDGVSFTQEWQSGDIGIPRSLVVADVDSDGVKEIVAGVERGSEPNTQPDRGYIYVFNGQTHVQEWKSENINYPSMEVSDLDNDGRMEIVARTLTGHADLTGVYQGYIYVFDGETHIQECKSDNLGCDDVLLVTDVDNDGVKEILVRNVTSGGFICFFDGVTHMREWRSVDIGVPGIRIRTGSIRVADVDDDGWNEIFAGGSSGEYHGCLYIFEITGGGNQPPNPPTLISPGYNSEPGEVIYNLTPIFHWDSVPNADYYGLYISKYPYGPSNIVFDSELDYGPIYGSSFTLPSGILVDGEKYRWNMRAYNSNLGWSEFSSRLFFEAGLPYWCSILLEKNGMRIYEVNVWEFFDVHIMIAGNFHNIAEIRFSSDDVQDSFPSGKWTKWYSWDVSSDDWDASTKIKRWAFATPGYKEVWVQLKDEMGQTVICFANIFVPAPALPVLTSPLVITPVKEFYQVGDSLEASFTIENIGDVPITLDILTVGGRLNGFIPEGGAPDFTFQSVTLQPHQPYNYHGSLTVSEKGKYHFFVAYHIENPTQDEKQLLDENGWNTCIQLGYGLEQIDRVKDIVVFEETTIPEDVVQLREKINRLKSNIPDIPAYLLDSRSFRCDIANYWADFTSFITQTGLTKKYDILYSTGVNYHRLSVQALTNADELLDSGDIDGAKKYLNKYYRYRRLSENSFSAAIDAYKGALDAGTILAKGVRDGCEASVKFGLKIVFPPAAPAVDAIYTGIDFAVDATVDGVDQATKNLISKVITECILKKISFVSLRDDMLIKHVNRIAEKELLDELLGNKEFMNEFGPQLREVIVNKVVNGLGIMLSDKVIDEIVKKTIDSFEDLINYIESEGKCPVKLRVVDSNGSITGLIDREVKHEIPVSLYSNGTVKVFFPYDSYKYIIAGVGEGIYRLKVTSFNNWNLTVFNASGVPISSNETHQYTINWSALSQGEKGVTIEMDYDGDGVFDKTITADNELTHDEFILQTETIIDINPDTLNLNSKGKWITCHIELPEGYDVADINVSTILLNDAVPAENHPTNVGDYDNDGLPDLMVKFNRQTVQDILELGGKVTINVTGELIDGTPFKGTDYIRVINKIPFSGIAGIIGLGNTKMGRVKGVLIDIGPSQLPKIHGTISADDIYVFNAGLYPNGMFRGYMIYKDRCRRRIGLFTGDWFIYHGWLRLVWNWRDESGWAKARLETFGYPLPSTVVSDGGGYNAKR